jgi:mycoredoxin
MPNLPQNLQIQVYGAQWCPLTLGFRKYFIAQQIPFAFFDTEADPAATQAAKAMNQGKLKFPMVVVGRFAGYWSEGADAQVLKNPKLLELRAALKAYGI